MPPRATSGPPHPPPLLWHHACAGLSPPAPCRQRTRTSHPSTAGEQSGSWCLEPPPRGRWALGLQAPRHPPSSAALQAPAGRLSTRSASTSRPLCAHEGSCKLMGAQGCAYESQGTWWCCAPCLSHSHAGLTGLCSPRQAPGPAHLQVQGSGACCYHTTHPGPGRKEPALPGIVFATARIS